MKPWVGKAVDVLKRVRDLAVRAERRACARHLRRYAFGVLQMDAAAAKMVRVLADEIERGEHRR